jgi:2,3-dihydroxybenzoate-AMP ligase
MTTSDYVAFHAAERPDTLALISNGRQVSYAELARTIGKFARALDEFGLPWGSSVAIACDDLYVHWLLLLACEHRGVATASISASDMRAPLALRASVDLVLAGPGIPITGAPQDRSLTPEWLQGVFARADVELEPAAPGKPDDLIRIAYSSGTTGTPKRILLLRRMIEPRMREFAAQFEFTPQSRYLLTGPLNVLHMYGVTMACVRSGGTVVFDLVGNTLNVARSVSAYGITRVSLFPMVLKQVLDALPRGFVKPPNLTIHSIGAPISEALRERALQRLAVDFLRGYGCNETAAVYVSRAPRADSFGSIWPEIEVEIVDDNDRPLPSGTIGHIRLRTQCMVDEYPDDPEATHRCFKNGWFYPQDMGMLNEARQLKVVGRSTEVINIGGQKVAPGDLEDFALRNAPIADAGACSFPNSEGIEEIYIAVSLADGDANQIVRRIADALSRHRYRNFCVLTLPSIPRNANGKIQRDLLKQAVAAKLGR